MSDSIGCFTGRDIINIKRAAGEAALEQFAIHSPATVRRLFPLPKETRARFAYAGTSSSHRYRIVNGQLEYATECRSWTPSEFSEQGLRNILSLYSNPTEEIDAE